MDRFKSPRIENDSHLLTVMTYIDLNQHRAGKVKHPRDNEWSSFAYYAYGRDDDLITPAPSYLALGSTEIARRSVYREMVESLIKKPSSMNISDTYFIGDPNWVIARYGELKKTLMIKRIGKCLSPPE